MELCRATSSFLPITPQTHHQVYKSNRKRYSVLVCATSSNSASSPSSKENRMVISITGATGFVGQRLVQKLLADDHTVHALTRNRRNAQLVFPVEKFPQIIIAEEGEWKNSIQGSNAVINLAGMPISTRWSSEIKKEIKESRIRVTSKVVDLINNCQADLQPSVLVSGTAIGYYGTSETQVFDEGSPSGNDYLSEVCREWEGKALDVDKDVRLVLIRIGVVLGKDGGALACLLQSTSDGERAEQLEIQPEVTVAVGTVSPDGQGVLYYVKDRTKMIPIFRMFAGGPLGNGQQWFSWIHLDDLVNLIYEAIKNPSYKGVINGTAPNPVRLSEMCEQLGQVMGRPSWLPVPDFALKALLGEGATIVLEGQRVLPVKAKELGFSFKYPYVKDALNAIISSKVYS